MTDHYPNINDLLKVAADNMVMIPTDLVVRLNTRFAGAKDAYATDQVHVDGRIVNACMLKNSFQDMEEEIVDAVFNAMVALLKSYPDSRVLLNMIITIWQMTSAAMAHQAIREEITLLQS